MCDEARARENLGFSKKKKMSFIEL